MKTIQKIIQTGFAACALASASMPALSWTVWPDVDFEWYAQVGKAPPPSTLMQEAKQPAPRLGYIWVPAHYETVPGNAKQLVAGRWIRDDFREQVAVVMAGPGTMIATGPTQLYDRQGNPIPNNPEAYPVDSARR